MKQKAILPYAAAVAALIPACLASPRLEKRQADDAAAAAVCKPPVKNPNELIPPCSHIEYIETMCWPKGSEPVHFDGHAQCMCKGSFFDEWVGCQKCLQVHGFRNEREIAFYNSVVSSASEMLCSGTPTAPFRSLFVEAEQSMMPVTTGDTVNSDQFPGKTDISLYYTPSGTQGLGEITGPAATITRAGGLATAGPDDIEQLSSGASARTTGTRTTSSGGTTSPSADSAANSTRSTLGLVVALAGMAAIAVLK